MLNKKHQKTLEAIFDRPTRANIRWDDIEKLFAAMDAIITNKGGSMVSIRMGERRILVHRPHPQKEAKKGLVDHVRTFLTELKITP
jgi:hypothetical protein